jgi:cysteinyl-tRNA synthetase
MTTIQLHNTATRTKEIFAPIDPLNVRMYVCGPTVYDRAHLGNARPVVVFDVLFRLLRHVYGADHVTYARNFTDVDDKINATAQARKAAGDARPIEALIRERTEETIAWYHADMDALGALRPTLEPRATDFIAQMIAMIQSLVANGHAYAKDGHVLFRVRSYAAYGALSGRSVDDMIAGARVEIAPFKEDAMDFVLWKPSDADLPGWDSPWGRGRPGWHIECSAMSHELLGAAFDIHGGGLDLQFPHHENEIAQSHCAHPEAGFAKIWMHNEMLQVEGKKMSKSLGNFFTVRDLLDKGVPGEVMRMVFLGTHYRKPMDWRADKSRDAERALRRWRKLTEGVEPSNPAPEVVNFLCDDLNTAGAIDFLGHLGQVLFQRSKEANEDPVSTTRSEKRDELAKEFLASAQLLGLLLEGDGQWTETPDLNPIAYKLSELRNSAALTKDFSAVDALKAALVAAGVDVRMSKTGVELVPGPGFDLMKLKGLG